MTCIGVKASLDVHDSFADIRHELVLGGKVIMTPPGQSALWISRDRHRRWTPNRTDADSIQGQGQILRTNNNSMF